MMKKKVLITYYTMMMGGSTTSLLAFLNCIDKEKYEVDLQLYRNGGELFEFIPQNITLLPPAVRYHKVIRKPLQILKGIFGGYFLRARSENKKIGKPGYAQQVLSIYQARALSKPCKKHYDYAIGFLEGWSDVYLAEKVSADKKYAWIHSTYENIAPIPHLDRAWMDKVDQIVFVTDQCTSNFKQSVPDMAEKAITVDNILDSSLIKKRSMLIDQSDADYAEFSAFDGIKIITVCRIDINIKGLDRLLNCAKHLKDNKLKFMWYIVGGGIQLDGYRAMIQEYNLQDCVCAIGEKLNPYPFMKIADIYCMLSRYEGKPMSVTESMILGTPPLVTEYLSAKEQIRDGVEGWIVKNEDTSANQTLASLIRHPETIRKAHNWLNNQEYGNCAHMKDIQKILFGG